MNRTTAFRVGPTRRTATREQCRAEAETITRAEFDTLLEEVSDLKSRVVAMDEMWTENEKELRESIASLQREVAEFQRADD